MTTPVRLLVGALFLSSLFAACTASVGQPPQYSEVEQCARSGGTWRAAACESSMGSSGGGY